MNHQTRVQIVNKLGLHARASAKLVKLAAGFAADIRLARDGREVNAKSIMGVMMLAAAKGAEVDISATGEDAAAAIEALCDLIARRFDEGE